jgi:hypothetical protein
VCVSVNAHKTTCTHACMHEPCFQIQTSGLMLIKKGKTQNVSGCIVIKIIVVLTEMPWCTVQEEKTSGSSLKIVTY